MTSADCPGGCCSQRETDMSTDVTESHISCLVLTGGDGVLKLKHKLFSVLSSNWSFFVGAKYWLLWNFCLSYPEKLLRWVFSGNKARSSYPWQAETIIEQLKSHSRCHSCGEMTKLLKAKYNVLGRQTLHMLICVAAGIPPQYWALILAYCMVKRFDSGPKTWAESVNVTCSSLEICHQCMTKNAFPIR